MVLVSTLIRFDFFEQIFWDISPIFFAFKLTKDGNIQRSEKDVNVGQGMRYQKMVAAALIGYF